MDSNSVELVTTNPGLVNSAADIISSVIYAGATIFAACVAIYGVNSWKREFRGKRQIELAEDVLGVFYEAKDAISAIRSPFSYGGEGSTRKPVEGEPEQEKKVRNTAYTVWERYDKHQGVFNKLHSMRYRFMAQIGKEEAEPFEQMRKIVNRILTAAGSLSGLWVERGRLPYKSEENKELSKEVRRLEAIFWWQGSKDDIDKEVAEIIARIEETCKPIIMKARAKH